MTRSGTVDIARPRSWAQFIPPVTRVHILVLVGLVLLAYWEPIRRDLLMRWLHDGNWSHGLLVPVFSLYFVITRKDALLRAMPRANYLGVVVVLGALTLRLAGVVYGFRYFEPLSLVGVIFGVTLLMGGWPIMRVAWFPILYLLLAVPLPQYYYVRLTMPLRELAASVAAAIMPYFAPILDIQAQGVVIDYVLPGKRPDSLNIEEACSGLRLMMAFVALGVAYAYLHKRPAWQRIIMVVSCVPIAVLCNTVRVTVTGLLQVHGRADLAQGTPHQLLGILMLVLALGLFMMIGYLLAHLFVDEPDKVSEDVSGTTTP